MLRIPGIPTPVNNMTMNNHPRTFVDGVNDDVIQRMFGSVLFSNDSPYDRQSLHQHTTEYDLKDRYLARDIVTYLYAFDSRYTLYALLPIEYTSENKIKFNQIIFDRGQIAETPQGVPPRLFTHRAESHTHTLTRYATGIVAYKENFDTAQGHQTIMRELYQILLMQRDANTFDILRAIVAASNLEEKDYLRRQVANARDLRRAMQYETTSWNAVRKSHTAMISIYNYVLEISRGIQADPINALLLKDEIAGYLSTSQLATFYESGPSGIDMRQRGIDQGSFMGVKIYPVRSFICNPGPNDENPLEHTTEIGEHYTLKEPIHGDSADYLSSMLTIRLPNDETLDWFYVTLADAVNNLPIWKQTGALKDIRPLYTNANDYQNSDARKKSLVEYSSNAHGTRDTEYVGQFYKDRLTLQHVLHAARVVERRLPANTLETVASLWPKILSYINTMANIDPYNYPQYWEDLFNENQARTTNDGSKNRTIKEPEVTANPVTGTLKIPTPRAIDRPIYPLLPPSPDFATLKACGHLVMSSDLDNTVWKDRKEAFKDMGRFTDAFSHLADALYAMFPDSPFINPKYAHSRHHNPTRAEHLFETLVYPDTVPIAFIANELADEEEENERQKFMKQLSQAGVTYKDTESEFIEELNSKFEPATQQPGSTDELANQAIADQKQQLLEVYEKIQNLIADPNKRRRAWSRTPMCLSFVAVKAYLTHLQNDEWIRIMPMIPTHDNILVVAARDLTEISNWLDSNSVENIGAVYNPQRPATLVPYPARTAEADHQIGQTKIGEDACQDLGSLIDSTDFMARYSEIWAHVTDTLMRMLSLLYISTPFTRDASITLINHNIPLPYAITVVRPHMRYHTSYLIFMHAGQSTGSLFVKPPTVTMKSDEGRGQEVVMTTTFYNRAIVHKPTNILRVPHAWVQSHISGATDGWIQPETYDPHTYDGRESMIAIIHGLDENTDDVMPLPGKLSIVDPSLPSSIKNLHKEYFSTSPLYRNLYKLDHINDMSDMDESNIGSVNQTRHNFLTFKGMYKEWSPSTKRIDQLNHSTGHWQDQSDFGVRLFNPFKSNHALSRL